VIILHAELKINVFYYSKAISVLKNFSAKTSGLEKCRWEILLCI